MASCRRALDVVDRALIGVRLADGWTIRAIARALNRSPGMVSDEVARHGGRAGYAACAAQAQAASARSRCGRKSRLGTDGTLLGEVADLLRRGWSPEQIAGRRRRIEDGVEQQADREPITNRGGWSGSMPSATTGSGCSSSRTGRGQGETQACVPPAGASNATGRCKRSGARHGRG